MGSDPALYKLSVATYLLLPGAPDVQDGEEIVWAGAAVQAADANGLPAHDKQLIALRQARPSIRRCPAAALHPRAVAPLLADAQGRASVPLAAQSFAVCA